MAAFERATVGLVLWWSANNAFAADPASVLSVSRLGVAETAERIEQDARSRGLTVVACADLSGDARRAGLSIRPVRTVSIDYGSDDVRTRLVIWKAMNGATVVSVDERALAADRSDAALSELLRPSSPAAMAAGSN